MAIMGLRTVYERFGLTDVIEEEMRLIHLGMESSLEIIINELSNRCIEKHLDSNLYIAGVEVEPNPFLIVITLQGISSVNPEADYALELEQEERSLLVRQLVSFMNDEIIEKIKENGYTPEDIARDYYVRKLGAIGHRYNTAADPVLPVPQHPGLDFYKSITIDFENSKVINIEF